MKLIKFLFTLFYIFSVFNIVNAQSNKQTKIDNIFFELALNDMGLDKNIDNFCDNSLLEEIKEVRISLTAATFNNNNDLKPNDFLRVKIDPVFSIESSHKEHRENPFYLIKANNFKSKKPKWKNCTGLYFNKFLSKLTYVDFINQKWDFIMAMKNLEDFTITIESSCESNIDKYTVFTKNKIFLNGLINLKKVDINIVPYYIPANVLSEINRNLNEILVFGNNDKLKEIKNITYKQFYLLCNSSDLKQIETLVFSHPIDTLLNVKKIKKINNLYIDISKLIKNNNTFNLKDSFSILDFVDTVENLYLTTNIDFKKTTQFDLIFNTKTVVEFLDLAGFENPMPYNNVKNFPMFTLNIDISKYSHFINFNNLQEPVSYWNNDTRSYNDHHIRTKLILNLNTTQLYSYQNINPNTYFKKSDPKYMSKVPINYWFEINHIKTENEQKAEIEKIRIENEIKQKQLEFNNSLLSGNHDSKIKQISDDLIAVVLLGQLNQKEIELKILEQKSKLEASIGHKLTEDETNYFFKKIEIFANDYSKILKYIQDSQ